MNGLKGVSVFSESLLFWIQFSVVVFCCCSNSWRYSLALVLVEKLAILYSKNVTSPWCYLYLAILSNILWVIVYTLIVLLKICVAILIWKQLFCFVNLYQMKNFRSSAL